MKRLAAVLLLACLLDPQAAMAHSFSIYISTPISPPGGMEWVFYCSLPLLFLGNMVLLRSLGIANWRKAARVAGAVAGLFTVSFFLFGRVAAEMNTAPPPGLGWPSQPYLGWGWDRLGELFMSWNVAGLTCLAGWLGLAMVREIRWMWWLMLGLGGLNLVLVVAEVSLGFQFLPLVGMLLLLCFHEDWPPVRNGLLLVLGNVVLYAACLAPFIAAGTLAHGRAGSYAHGACHNNFGWLAQALIGYADRHEGKAPPAQDMDGLLKELSPYLPTTRFWPVDRCPTAGAFQREPVLYEWDASFAGKPLRELEEAPEDRQALACPFHREWIGQTPLGRSLRQARKEASREASEAAAATRASGL